MSAPETVRILTWPSHPGGSTRPRTRLRGAVRRLRRSGLPRGLGKHTGPDADAWRQYLMPMLRHLGLGPPVPDFALDAARSAGLAMLSLRHLEAELEGLQTRSGPGRRRKAEYQTEARIRKARVARRLCEQDLARLAKRAKPLTLAEAIRQQQGRETSA